MERKSSNHPPPSPPFSKSHNVRRRSASTSKIRTTPPPPSPTPSSITSVTSKTTIRRRERPPSTPPYGTFGRSGGKTTPSAWALSPGRSSSTVADVAYFGNSGSRKAGGVLSMFRSKKGSSAKEKEREEAMHELKVLESRYVQWRFVNSRAKKGIDVGNVTAERDLFRVWVKLGDLRRLVTAKRKVVEKLRLRMKLRYVLTPQLRLLRHWDKISERTANAVGRTATALQTCCIPVPLIDGAKVNVTEMENVMSDALLVVGELESKLKNISQVLYNQCCMDGWMLNQTDKERSSVNQLLEIIQEEMRAMEELVQLSNMVLALESQESSLRANLIQLRKGKSPSSEASTFDTEEDAHSSLLASASGDRFY